VNAYPLAADCWPIAILFILLWWYHRTWWTAPLGIIGTLLLAPIAGTLIGI
jgi:hypothetical protein